jgi:thymidylate synthase (FAD)
MIKATYIDHMGSDLSVVNAARVSFGKKSELVCAQCGGTGWVDDGIYQYTCGACEVGKDLSVSKRDTKLIHYLAEHKHTSPFGHAFASFHVKAPIFVARQLVKHKFLRWNEISRRYVDDEPEFYMPDVWRGRSADKKQGSEGVVDIDKYWEDLPDNDDTPMPSLAYEDSLYCYRDLLRAGVAPEQARMVLPQSTMTEWYWSGSLDAFADMCNLRCKPDTQLETRLVAEQIDDKMMKLFPVSWEALRSYED